MQQVPSLKIVLGGLVFILALHAISVFQEWYLSISWIDIVLHLLGGAWVALVFFYVQTRVAPELPVVAPVWFIFILILGFVMLVGVAWEWFEYVFDFFVAKDNFRLRAQLGLPDTMGDLLADIIGGTVLTLFRLIIIRKDG